MNRECFRDKSACVFVRCPESFSLLVYLYPLFDCEVIMSNKFAGFWKWCRETVSTNYKSSTVPSTVNELPCGCRRKKPVTEGMAALDSWRESRWRVSKSGESGRLRHVECGLPLEPFEVKEQASA